MPSSRLPLINPHIPLSIDRGDRWHACQRLQALDVPCHCTAEGTLVVEIRTPVDLLHLRSVVLQLTASRAHLLAWLTACWRLDA